MSELFEKKLNDNPFVYHYTSLETLLVILDRYKENINGGLPFRVSCIYNVNDPREMELGFNTIKKYLHSFEDARSNNMHLSDILDSLLYENKCIEQCNLKPKEGMIERGMIPYTISFSCLGDFLPMWSMYGNDKKGVCLKFNTCKLIEKLYGSCQVDFVSYDGENDDYIFNEHFSLLYNDEADSLNGKELTIEEKIDKLSLLCLCVSPFIKSKSWAYEEEFRIVYHHMYGPEITEEYLKRITCLFGRMEKEVIQKHISFQINAQSLDSIIIGPLADYKSIEHVVRNELDECLLGNVDVIPSTITIRC